MKFSHASIFQPLIQELDKWKERDMLATFWWRDDDLQTSTPNLIRILDISKEFEVPISFAAIPYKLDRNLYSIELLNIIHSYNQSKLINILQHGYSHYNYAPNNEKKQELGNHRPLHDIINELRTGHDLLNSLFTGSTYLPIIVPPWNRISDEVLGSLKKNKLPYIGLSRHGSILSKSNQYFKEQNIHIDVLNFKGKNAKFAGVEYLLNQAITHLKLRREHKQILGEATGLMTHHLVHDAQTWEFISHFVDLIGNHSSAKFIKLKRDPQ